MATTSISFDNPEDIFSSSSKDDQNNATKEKSPLESTSESIFQRVIHSKEEEQGQAEIMNRTLTWSNGDKYVGDIVHGNPHGEGVYIYSNGDKYKGDFQNGQRTGRGVFTWFDGDKDEKEFDRYEGEFVDGQLTGKGIFTYKGNKHEGYFVNGYLQGNTSNLTDLKFLNLLIGKDVSGTSGSYGLGIISDYLIKNGDEKLFKFGKSLESANDVYQSKSGDNIYKQLLQGKSQLLLFEPEGHYMGLNLVPDNNSSPEFVTFEIFNSGEGLSNHKKNDSGKYQTMLRIQVPIESIGPFIRSYGKRQFQNADAVYQCILNLPGAEIVESDSSKSGPPIWQTEQKGENCSVEWIFAYLKNKMSEPEYHKMRRDLFQKCIHEIQKNGKTVSNEYQTIVSKLKEKVSKRTAKLNIP